MCIRLEDVDNPPNRKGLNLGISSSLIPFPTMPLCNAMQLTQDIHATQHAQPQNHTTPEADVIQRLPALDPLRPLQHHNRQLAHLRQEAVPPDLLRDAPHDDLVADGRDEEGDQRRHRPADVRARRAVDVPPEEVVHGDVPLARELEPVCTVPPVGVEVPICEACADC